MFKNKKSILATIFSFLLSSNLYALDITNFDDYDLIEQDDLIPAIDQFIKLPKGATPWNIFGETGMDEYFFVDEEGNDWIGYRPIFKKKIKKLEKQEVLVQGYMFPLEQGEKQGLFLLGPFPLSCPYHPHTAANLTIEVKAKAPITFSYDPVNIKGILELVPKDDIYNIFFRLNNAELFEN